MGVDLTDVRMAGSLNIIIRSAEETTQELKLGCTQVVNPKPLEMQFMDDVSFVGIRFDDIVECLYEFTKSIFTYLLVERLSLWIVYVV